MEIDTSIYMALKQVHVGYKYAYSINTFIPLRFCSYVTLPHSRFIVVCWGQLHIAGCAADIAHGSIYVN